MTETEATQRRPSRWRFAWWLALLLLGILIGWLLAPRCPRCSAQSATGDAQRHALGSDAAAAAKGGGARDKGTPDHGRASGSSDKTDLGAGPGHEVRDASGPGMGHKTGTSKGDAAGGGAEGSDPLEPPADTLAGGPTQGNGTDPANPTTPNAQILSADDFRYDKTGLPRYSQAVSTVTSSLAQDQLTSRYHSTCGIVTSSKFQDVVDWYKAHLPQGWQVQSVGDLNALAGQVSIASIMNTLTAAAQSTGTPAAGTPVSKDSTAADSNSAISVAMLSAPPGSSGEPSIMIQQKAGQPVQITMSKNGGNP